MGTEAAQRRRPGYDEIKHAGTLIRENVAQSSVCGFDSHYAYRDLGDSYVHSYLDQGATEHVRGVYHTNTTERYWPLLKLPA